MRNLRKKLAEIAALEQRVAEGSLDPSAEQREKIGRRGQLEEELQGLEDEATEAAEEEAAESTGVIAPNPTLPWADPLTAKQKEPGVKVHNGHHGAKVPPIPKKSLEVAIPDGDDAVRATTGALEQCNGHHSGPELVRVHSPHWQEDPVGVEDLESVLRPTKESEFEFIEAVQPFGTAVQSSERLRALVKAVSGLSVDAFEEDALDMVTRKSRWKLTLLARPATGRPAQEGPEPALIGFVIYRLRPELQSLSVAKLAIVPEHRRKGHGCRLIDWCIRLARKQSSISFISLSSLPEAVRFYQRLGFKKFEVIFGQDGEVDEDLVEGQVYMEKPIKGRGGGGRGKAGSRRAA